MVRANKGTVAMASQVLDRTCTRFLLRCWGDFAMTDAEGGDVRPRGRKARALLAYLAMHPDKPVSRERLMALLWSDRADEQARGSLRQTLFELKPFGNGHGLVSVERDSVTLNSGALVTDIDRLSELARSGCYDELLALLPDQDESLFSNLDGLSAGWDDWLQIERSRQQDGLQALILDAAAAATAAGQVRAARTLQGRLAQSEVPAFEPRAAASHLAAAPIGPTKPNQPAVPSRRSLLRLAVAAPLVAAGAVAGLWWTSGSDGSDQSLRREAAGLTDSAKAMLRDRDSANMRAARDLLRRAVSLTPDYAPGWAALAIASAMGQSDPKQLAEAEAQARKAIAFDPNLATDMPRLAWSSASSARRPAPI